jgi:hypothetical protein
MKIDTYANLEALMDAELDDAIISASTRDLGVDVSDPPFMLPATYDGITGPRRTPRGIYGVPPSITTAGARFDSHLACPRCGQHERVAAKHKDGLQSLCLTCKRRAERESKRRARSRMRSQASAEGRTEGEG